MTNREYRARMREINKNHRYKMADIKQNHGTRMAEIDRDSKKNLADIKARGKINLIEIDKKYKDKRIIREYEYSNRKNADAVAIKKLKKSDNVYTKKVKSALSERNRLHSDAEERFALRMLLVNAKYNRSCLGLGDKLLSLILTVAILAFKLGLFILDVLPGKQETSSFIYNSIFNLSQSYTWLPILVVPIFFVLVSIINIISSINAKVHELVTGVATVFMADLLIKVANQNPSLNNPQASNEEYIAAAICIFLMIWVTFTAICYPTLRALLTSAKQKHCKYDLQSAGQLVASESNPSSDTRSYYYKAGRSISGKFFDVVIAVVVFIMAAVATAGWLLMVSKTENHTYYFTIAILFVIPSLINMFEIGSRSTANENLFSEFIDSGSEFLPKVNAFNLAVEQLKNTLNPLRWFSH